ncbi:hypothetical protein J4207_06475 [Candidatus Woesearchaeota archaeon]|nr:hypothetical protein [Candidatus Woesearchaeota archaeon]
MHRVSRTELIDLTKGWIAISFAFAIALHGLSFSFEFLTVAAIAALTVGVGFIFHELAHKIVAQRYGCWAEFRADDKMLLFALLLSVFGFIFAAPGAVIIDGVVTKKENGLIAVVGSWTNLVLAVLFLALMPVIPVVASYGVRINAWLAIFNMIPLWILDGKKVFVWNKLVWGATVVIGIGLLFVV